MIAVDPYMIATAVAIFSLTALSFNYLAKKTGRGALGLFFAVGSLLLKPPF
jgi:hypothetical protein